MYIVVVDGKGHGLFGSEDVAWQWATVEFPVAYAQKRVQVVTFEFVTVNEERWPKDGGLSWNSVTA